MAIKSSFRKIIPAPIFSLYHFLFARLADVWYAHPSGDMVVIGITGTKGKTSAANFIWSCLQSGGYKTGLIGTANIRIGEKETLNTYHMTMPGRFALQKMLYAMRREGCTHCVVETTSEGIKQWRHLGIAYDAAVFTNLFPEHLEAHHGSFEEYRSMKGKMFSALKAYPHKHVKGRRIEKTIVVNADSPEKDFFLGFWADRKITFAAASQADFRASHIESSPEGIELTVNSENYKLALQGEFNALNALAAIAVSSALGIPHDAVKRGLRNLAVIPGRMEVISEGQDYTIFIDYAHERESMNALIMTAGEIAHKRGGRLLILLGAEGGGRDKAKRPAMGELAGTYADYAVISNVDPYDDDPLKIIEDIAIAAEKTGKTRNQNLFLIPDRREGIRKILALAKKGDVACITGKGSEQSMVIKGARIPWDDRIVTREELRQLRQ